MFSLLSVHENASNYYFFYLTLETKYTSNDTFCIKFLNDQKRMERIYYFRVSLTDLEILWQVQDV